MTTWRHDRRPGRRGFPKKTRARILRDQPECQLQFVGCEGESTIADHIVGWADAVAAGWDENDVDDPSNGQGVCGHCHRIKTAQEARRGRERTAAERKQRRSKQRPTEAHPGLIEPNQR